MRGRTLSRSLLVVLGLGLLSSFAESLAPSRQMRQLTTDDSIQIAYIDDLTIPTVPESRGIDLPPGNPIYSPDGKRFVLTTQRGLLDANCLEGTIWLFDSDRVKDYILGKTKYPKPPVPIAKVRAQSNTPVLSEVRWKDSETISFLGKQRSPYQRLFLVNLHSRVVKALTNAHEYVTQYDISRTTIAYTTLAHAKQRTEPSVYPIPVADDLTSLVYPTFKNSDLKQIDDLIESDLYKRASVLHVIKDGAEIVVPGRSDGEHLELFLPTLAVSPDGKKVITVAPVRRIPAEWQDYAPVVDDPKYSNLRLKPENKYSVTTSPWRASQYVLVDLQHHSIDPIVDAPVGRSLGYGAPTKGFWSADSRHAVLCNTFVPFANVQDDAERLRRQQRPAVLAVDVVSGQMDVVSYLYETLSGAKRQNRVKDFSWVDNTKTLTIEYMPTASSQSGEKESISWTAVGWATQLMADSHSQPPTVLLSVEQDLNHWPTLIGRSQPNADPKTVWDPNPQLKSIVLSDVSLYSWHDGNGNKWSGLLSPPTDYESGHRYPLVIQLYGYDPTKFFVNGTFTTGYPGRLLSAKGVVVLQIGWPTEHIRTPQDGPFQLQGFQSAVDQLTHDGLVDPGRIGIIGFSFTCYYVLYAITHRPDLFAAALFTDGNTISYWQYLVYAEWPGGMQGLIEEINDGAPFGPGLQRWFQDVPAFNLENTKTPLLIASYENWSLLSQWGTYAALRTLRKPVEMVWVPKGNWPHILVQPAHQQYSQELSVDWFCYWLKSEEDKSAGKSSQYRRWDQLRELQKVRDLSTPGNKRPE